MPAHLIDLAGKTFGRLTVIRRVARPIGLRCGGAFWECCCRCGVITIVLAQNLRNGATRSCGCMRVEFARARHVPSKRFVDLKGQRFGRWQVGERDCSPRGDKKSAYWHCRCDCGMERSIAGAALANGTSKSCGCLRKEVTRARSVTHGASRTTEYLCWKNMKNRCYNANNICFHIYGARGIKVCDRWLNSFENFLADMGPRPSANHEIDRWPDNDGGYEPGNVRWATQAEQAQNTRRTVLDPKLVHQLRAHVATGGSPWDWARTHRIGSGTVWFAIHGVTWADI